MGQTPDRPQFPANLVGDFGGGSTYLVIGLLAALLEARVSGQGQVVDAAIVDGTAHLNAMTSAFLASGGYQERRGANLLDGGVPFYDVYETSDGKHVSVGALEPQFYATLIGMLGLEGTAPGQADLDRYDELRTLLTDTFKQKTQAEWVELFEGTDACVAGVIPVSEAPEHPHLKARATFVEHEGLMQPQPAPRFSRTGASLSLPPSPAAGTAHPRRAHRVGHRRCGRAHRARCGGPGVRALPVPGHPRPGRRRGRRVRRGPALRRARRARRTPGAHGARRARSRWTSTTGPGSSSAAGRGTSATPRSPSRPSSGAARPGCGSSRCRRSTADFPFLGACYGIGTLGTLGGGVVDRTVVRADRRGHHHADRGGRGRPAARRAAAVLRRLPRPQGGGVDAAARRRAARVVGDLPGPGVPARASTSTPPSSTPSSTSRA